MRRFVTPLLLLLVACALLIPAQNVAAAGFPLIPGTYKQLDNEILPGRGTESMPADFAEGQLGNMIWAESWDGTALGTDWKVMCPQISGPATLLFDGVIGGTGQRIYITPYSGGTLWLSGAGPWAGGAPFYTATITSFTVTATKQYVGGQLTGVVSSINFMGNFEGEGQCFSMVISNAELVGMTGHPVLPPPAGIWPAFHGPYDCDLIGSHGTYWNVHDVTLDILGNCATPSQPSTWGRVKSLYR